MVWPALIPIAVAAAPKIYKEVVWRPEKRAREARERQREAEEKARESERRLAVLLKDLGYNEDAPTITEEIIKSSKEAVGYDTDKLNIVFAGNVSVGKSSLINGLCNKGGKDGGVAPVGSNQVTEGLARYEVPNHTDVVLYDVPGAGTQEVRAFRYYYDQRLYAFDVVVLVHETTLTEADIRLLQMCILSNQTCLAVRTKSDEQIRNYEYDKECDSSEARKIFLDEARKDIQRCKKQITAPWPESEIEIQDYIVNSRSIRKFMTGESSPEDAATAYIEEDLFVRYLFTTLLERKRNK